MELNNDKCKDCTVENMCTTGTVPNSEECFIKGGVAEIIGPMLPIELTTVQTEFETKIVDETNTYIARMGYNIKLNKEELVEMLQMYLNPSLKQGDIERFIQDSKYKSITIFDKKEDCYILVWLNHNNKLDIFYFGNECETSFTFEEGRFYAREIKDAD